MIKKFVLVTVLGLLFYTTFLVIELPAAVVWQQLEPRLNLPRQLQVATPGGTLWNGHVALSYRGQVYQARWAVKAADLVKGRVALTLNANGEGADVAGDLAVGLNKVMLSDVTGYVSSAAVQPFLRGQRVTVDGRIDIDVPSLVASREAFVRTQGQLRWSGGNIAFPVGRQQKQQQFPPFVAKLDDSQGHLVIDIRDESADFAVIETRVQPDGLTETVVKKRLVDLAGEPWPNQAKETDTVFKVKRKLL